ncbi:hypothetical protein DH2020_011162 [Rehmannia glutinosa]|uniref:Large ribosomal subunit protein uL10-like insertion domain-containing protein n=1 Tax=Rehmannia glutinosa TaxID=99300 RepID=A0ABR0XCP1_REHGL
MPKSKRNRPVTLSKTKKKGREHKENVVTSIRDAVEKYDSAYVFTFENMRNLKFKEFRDRLKSSSRFFLGSNKVMQVALGRSVADEIRSGLHKISKVELKEGPLDQFTHEMEPFLRKQGMPVRLNKGVVELVSDFVVCEEGKPISPESSRILRLLGIKMATFKLHLICRWSSEDFEVYREGLEDSDIESS